ncbi:MAG: glycosyltransferase family 4 protein [Candidatus Wallbacteria bacterium]|nr:glycosyltransferase family 4 protein [Candidatus Wallbacteria bacterium]
MAKILLICYDFPPVNGSAVPRIRAMSRGLIQSGHELFVITREPLDGEPLDSESQNGLEPARVYRIRLLPWRLRERGSETSGLFKRLVDKILVPSTKTRFLLKAFQAGCRICSHHKFDLILSSTPPHEINFVAALLSKKFGIPLFIDLRDAWVGHPGLFRGKAARNAVDSLLERISMRQATFCTAVSDEITELVKKRHPRLSMKSETVYNGWEEEYFSPGITSPGSGPLIISYLGSLGGHRSPEGLFQGLRLLKSRFPDLSALLKVRLIGRCDDQPLQRAEELNIRDIVTFHGQVPLREACAEMQRSHALLLILFPEEGGMQALTGKFFYYLGAGRPIIALAEGSLAGRWVNEHRLGICVPPGDCVCIASAIEELMERSQLGKSWNADCEFAFKFRRDRQVERLVCLVESCFRK